MLTGLVYSNIIVQSETKLENKMHVKRWHCGLDPKGRGMSVRVPFTHSIQDNSSCLSFLFNELMWLMCCNLGKALQVCVIFVMPYNVFTHLAIMLKHVSANNVNVERGWAPDM